MDNRQPDIIRQGVVSSVNYEAGSVRVLYGDKNDAVTQELPLLTFEYDMPRVGDQVYVSHQSDGVENGLVLGRYWRDSEMPAESGPHIWRREFRDGAGSFIRFDRETHTLTVDIAASPDVSVVINAAKDTRITSGGNVTVDAAENLTVNAQKKITVNAGKKVELTTKKPVEITAKQEITLTSRKAISLVAPVVNEVYIPPEPDDGDDE